MLVRLEDEMEKLANGHKPIDLNRSSEYGSQIIHAAEGGSRWWFTVTWKIEE